MDAPAELLYFVDPMCSWCWGFAPSVLRLADRFQVEAPLSVILGGLWPGNEKPLDQATKDTISKHWRDVAEASGQPFDHTFFSRPHFVYDTEPACRAVVTARSFQAARALPMVMRLHEAFYAENQDITDPNVLAALGAEVVNVEAEVFRESFESETVQDETDGDFQLARELGVKGFPTLIVRKDAQFMVVTQGWCADERLEPVVTQWLTEVDQGG